MNRSSQLGKQVVDLFCTECNYIFEVSLFVFEIVGCMLGLLFVLLTLHSCHRSPYGGGLTGASAC